MNEELEKSVQNENTEAVVKRPFFCEVLDYVEIFVFSVIAVLLIYTFGARICSVVGDSMLNTLHNKEKLIISDLFYTPDQGDIVVFHHITDISTEDRLLVKRVIATGGQHVEINAYTKKLYVDGKEIVEDYAHFDSPYYDQWLFGYGYNAETGIFECDVPEGYLFVLGDNRNNSKDSRSQSVGFVDERTILGEVKVRISPFYGI